MYSTNEKDFFAVQRAAMVQEQLKGRDIADPAVLELMASMPREKFVPAEFVSQAYSDCPVAIGCGQTISQPYMVAIMTQELKLDKSCSVLEIGTGSGYQAAILAGLAGEVCTIERMAALSLAAQKVLSQLAITNVKFYVSDGTCGWYENIKFDRIIVTAASAKLPDPLLRQLKIGGIVIAPLGEKNMQELCVIKKTETGIKSRTVCCCKFVKLIGKFGYTEQE